jgi:hypothetical protein
VSDEHLAECHRTEDDRLELSNFAREWLNDLRRESGGYSAEVFRHINAQSQEIERLREILTFPRIAPEAPAEQLMDILHDHDKGRPVNAKDLINALAWRVRNQRREISKLHERLRKKQSDDAPSFSPNFDKRNGIR